MYQKSLIFKLCISGVCLLLLLLLFIFGDSAFQEETQIISQKQENESERDSFIFDPPELMYDGTGELDLLEGVSLDQLSKEELKKIVFVNIYTDKTLSEKIIEYTADTEQGRIRSKRALYLIDYEGPKIELPEELPTVTMDTVNRMSDLLKSEPGYKVNDGFGNDVREYVQIDAEKSSRNSAEIQYTFIFENAFGDRAVAKAETFISDVPAVIVLTTSEVNIRAGEVLYPKMYIEDAIDMNGQSIVEEVQCDDEIVFEEPGEYVIEYELRGQKTSLRVVITE